MAPGARRCRALDFTQEQAILGQMMRTSTRLSLAALLACACASLAAAPAPWFTWRSKLDGKQVCAQTPLGPGWEKAGGPYKDSHCEKLVIAK